MKFDHTSTYRLPLPTTFCSQYPQQSEVLLSMVLLSLDALKRAILGEPKRECKSDLPSQGLHLIVNLVTLRTNTKSCPVYLDPKSQQSCERYGLSHHIFTILMHSLHIHPLSYTPFKASHMQPVINSAITSQIIENYCVEEAGGVCTIINSRLGRVLHTRRRPLVPTKSFFRYQ